MGQQVITVTQPNPNGAFVQSLTDTVEVSTGTPDASKVVVTGPDGKIDPSLIDGGDIGLPIPATEVTYDNTTYPTVEAALNFLLFIGLLIESFTSDQAQIHEVGSAVPVVTLIWVFNKTITGQSINQGIGTLDPTLRTTQVTFPTPGLTTTESWTLTATDGVTSPTATTSVSFQPKAYFGPSPNTSLDNDQILALGSNAFATALTRSMTFDCTGGAFPYYCYPASFGLPTNVVVGGLSFTAYNVTVMPVTNAQGFTQSYNVIRFSNLQNGNNIQVSWS